MKSITLLFKKLFLVVALGIICSSVWAQTALQICSGANPANSHQWGDYISNVNFAGINNTIASPYNSAFRTIYPSTSFQGQVSPGVTYPISIKTVGDITYQYVAVFIDWNQSGNFGTCGNNGTGLTLNEQCITWNQSKTAGGTRTFTGNITVPVTASIGKTYMRVVLSADDQAIPESFELYMGLGELQEYVINVATAVSAPTATTVAATSVTSTGVTLNGTVNANNAPTVVTFEYGTTTAYGSSVTATQSPVTGTSATAVSKAITGLAPNTTYHFRVKGVNSGGTTNGTDFTFKTLVAPTTISVVSAAGGLTASITAAGGDLNTLANLTITGNIDATDFKAMRDNMPALSVLDMSGASIAAYTGTDGTQGTSTIVYPVNEIPNSAFYNPSTNKAKTSLTSIVFPSSLTSIGNGAFSSCSGLTCNLMIPTGVTNLGAMCFMGCSGLTGNLNIPSSVKYIGSNAFQWCSRLKGSLTIPEGITTISQAAFNGCNGLNGSLTIPNSVTRIEHSAFEGCNGLISSVTIPNTVTYIGDNILNGCAKLNGTLTIGSGVNSIGQYAFSGCTGLTSINVLAVTPVDLTSSAKVFNYISTSSCKLTVPTNSYLAYSTANQWKDFFFINSPSTSSLTAFSAVKGTASASQTFSIGVSPTMLDLTVTAPPSFEVRESGKGSFGSSVTFTSASGSISTRTIEVIIAASAAIGSPSGNVVCSSTGAGSQNVAVSATVNAPAPTITSISTTSGSTAGGTTVTITGTNLTDATAVKFGATNASSYTVNSPTQISAIAPAGSVGAVDITVTTTGGTSATSSADQFTYVGNAMWQNQYMYIMKDGAVIKKQSIQPADLDSVVYTEPAHAVTTAVATNIGLTTATCGGSIFNNGLTVTARGVCWSTTTMPTIALSTKISNGTGTGAFSSSLTGLAGGTKYYVRAYATNSGGVTSYGAEQSFVTLTTDIDGNVYTSVTIGTQTWMVENLKTTKYRNGDAIDNVTGNTAWSARITGAWCDYSNTATNGTKYGHLYNWYAVSDTRNIAPVGWHVATDADWTKLMSYVAANLGTSLNAAKALAAATTDWTAYSTAGTVGNNLALNNFTGFSALPGGYRSLDGTFDSLSNNGLWWGSTEGSTSTAWYRYVGYNASLVGRSYHGKANGFSVRCVRD